MHEYDVALKRILTKPGSALLRELTGSSELRWLNVELPKVSNLRVDLLGALPDGDLVHVEFQSRNEKGFALRMAEYVLAIRRRYGRLPRQIALYVGEKPLRMTNRISGHDLKYRFHFVDVRDLDGEALLASKNLSDNVIAILTRLGDEPGAMRRILRRIARGPAEQREEARTELSILAGLRRLRGEFTEETESMPIRENILDNYIIGPLIRETIKRETDKAVEKALEEAMTQARTEAMEHGERKMLLAQIEKKFGSVSARTRARIRKLTGDELGAASLRLLDATRVGDLFAK